MKKYKYQFTVFTPVYNRKHTIHRVWNSLNAQTYRDFEWIIVDDGSTDNVMPLLEKYKSAADFPVTILTQENSGKHFAWNRALKISKGELYVPADSDDAFIPETLERFLYHWKNIPENERHKYSGINVLCKDPVTNNIVGDKFPKNMMITNNLEIRYKYKLKGEKWGCIRTDVLKKYLFPELKGRSCYSLGYLWSSIARRYQNVCVNETLRFYYQDSGNQITLTKDIKKTAPTIFHYCKWDLNTNLDYKIAYESPVKLLKSYINLWRLGWLLNNSTNQILCAMKGWSKLLTLISFPPAVLIYQLTYKKLK